MAQKRTEDSFSEQEAVRRLEAALRGAQIAGHKPMKSIVSKRPNSKES
jgi:hypothetical protein